MGKRLRMVNAAAGRLAWCVRGSSAAEFALILPVLMLMLFGTLQVSLLMYSYSLMAGAARDATRAMAVCTVTDPGTAAAQALANLPAWVKPTDWTITPVIGGPGPGDVSMTISVDPAKASIINLVPLLSGPLATHVTMRKEPLAFSSDPCGTAS